MFNPSTQVPGTPGELIDHKLRLVLLPGKERLPKFGTQFFVCVERQDPIMARRGSREILLLRKICPFPRSNLGPVLAGNLSSAVPASTVHHDDLIRNTLERTQGPRQVAFLVRRNETGGETIHRTQSVGTGVSISQRWFREPFARRRPRCVRVYFF